MANYKGLISGIGCRGKQVVRLCQTLGGKAGEAIQQDLTTLAQEWTNSGADGLLIYDFSDGDAEHDQTIASIKEAIRAADLPVLAGGRVRRLEDVKKYLYAGADAVFLDGEDEEHIDLIREAANRFGGEKIYVTISSQEAFARAEEFKQLGACGLISSGVFSASSFDSSRLPEGMSHLAVSASVQEEALAGILKEGACGVVLTDLEPGAYMDMKQKLAAYGLPMELLTSSLPWSAFHPNGEGLMPVVVQDYKTSEVLMVAYMDQQAFSDTLKTGKMHYYSRSRKTQWLKGETSGHFQYVKELRLDCDNDTILAKVHQIGAACHTGARSCFFQTLLQREYRETNPLKVFEEVLATIQDRKAHPKEGSYTNYLFDKGIDKILKKVGEEASEIIIAAKNPDPEEVTYEISDFLYHVMVLMVQKGLTWEEITEELSNR